MLNIFLITTSKIFVLHYLINLYFVDILIINLFISVNYLFVNFTLINFNCSFIFQLYLIYII